MTGGEPSRTDSGDEPDGDLAAGVLGQWLVAVRDAIDGRGDSDVPCGSCTACCRSSQFVHIGPDEVDTLAHVPEALLFEAPGLPPGHRVLGFDEHGACSLLAEDGCTIYDHRPRTCRTYDCRVFAATGVDVGADKPAIGARAVRWRFELGPGDGVRRGALRAAADRLATDADLRTALRMGTGATERAVLAVEVHDAFLDRDDAGGARLVEPEAAAVVDRARRRR